MEHQKHRTYSAGPAVKYNEVDYFRAEEGGVALVQVRDAILFPEFCDQLDEEASRVLSLSQKRRWVEVPAINEQLPFDHSRRDQIVLPRTLGTDGRMRRFFKITGVPNLFAAYAEDDLERKYRGGYFESESFEALGFKSVQVEGGRPLEWAYYDDANDCYLLSVDPTGVF